MNHILLKDEEENGRYTRAKNTERISSDVVLHIRFTQSPPTYPNIQHSLKALTIASKVTKKSNYRW